MLLHDSRVVHTIASGTARGALALALLTSAAAGCGSSSAREGFDDAGSDVDEDAGGGGELETIDAGPALEASDDAGDDGCVAAAKLVYVTGVGSELWSFYPPTSKFTRIGKLSCLDTPTHMTIDRQGNAWVVSGGDLYKASTSDASCSAVSTWKAQPAFTDFALTFLGTTRATDNTLYMLGPGWIDNLFKPTLATFDVASGTVTTIGNPAVSSSQGDMTTNGDGTLYFLLQQSPLVLYDLAPTTGAQIGSQSVDAPGGKAQGLAFWGGSFYAFEDSVIHRYDPKTKKTTSLGSAPLQVTGAGQSTCVPRVPPVVN